MNILLDFAYGYFLRTNEVLNYNCCFLKDYLLRLSLYRDKYLLKFYLKQYS